MACLVPKVEANPDTACWKRLVVIILNTAIQEPVLCCTLVCSPALSSWLNEWNVCRIAQHVQYQTQSQRLANGCCGKDLGCGILPTT